MSSLDSGNSPPDTAGASPWWARLAKALGPGFVTGTSDDDPSAIGTYAQAGAQFGLAQLWTAAITFPFMAAVQEMSGRIGLVTGQGLAAIIRENYARPVLYAIIALQVITNTVNIGADLSAMSQSAQLLWNLPYYVWLAILTTGTLALIVFVPYRTYAMYLKFLGLTLITYVAAAFALRTPWRDVLRATFVPTIRFNKDFLLTLVAVFGTTISPYEFFWQDSEEVEELIEEGVITDEMSETNPATTKAEVEFLRWDTISGMFFSNLITYFIILVAAVALARHGVTNINTATDAAQMLKPFAGPLAFWLFTTGIVSAGLLSIPVMAAASAYAVGGALRKPCSLAKPFWQEPVFYSVIVASTLVGLLINLLPVQPFKLLYYTAILNGIISPPLLFMVIRISGSKKIMGQYANSPFTNALGWILFAVMSAMLVALVAFPS